VSDVDPDPEALGLLQLREDPQYRRIPVDQRMSLVEAALEDGRALAGKTQGLWGRDPAAIAARCNVPVIHSKGDTGFGSVVVFAEYTTAPPCITLFLPAIARLDRAILKKDAEVYCSIADTAPIFLAHELYHHFDCLRGNERLSRRHPVKIFGVGRWHWSSGLSSLAEIAAGAFAQRLLGLPFHPKLLDLLIVQESKS
jgi:hypothetical protein